MSRFCIGFVISVLFAVIANAYKIPREAGPLPAIKNAPLEYKGPVFLIKETDDVNEPFIGLIVDGGIEMVRPISRPFPVPYANLPPPAAASNESIPEIQEDPDYFAVAVTPETVAQAQLSRTTTITIPLTMLLTGVSSRIPWLMVLKKKTHFDYFKTLTVVPRPMMMPLRRRHRREMVLERGSLVSGDRKYDMLSTKNDEMRAEEICVPLIRELLLLNKILNDVNGDNADPFDLKTNKNETKKLAEEYVVGTEYKPGSKHT